MTQTIIMENSKDIMQEVNEKKAKKNKNKCHRQET